MNIQNGGKQKTKGLRAKGINLAYDLMGTNETMSSNHGVSSSIGSRKKKEPTENSLRGKGKKIVGDARRKYKSDEGH